MIFINFYSKIKGNCSVFSIFYAKKKTTLAHEIPAA